MTNIIGELRSAQGANKGVAKVLRKALTKTISDSDRAMLSAMMHGSNTFTIWALHEGWNWNNPALNLSILGKVTRLNREKRRVAFSIYYSRAINYKHRWSCNEPQLTSIGKDDPREHVSVKIGTAKYRGVSIPSPIVNKEVVYIFKVETKLSATQLKKIIAFTPFRISLAEVEGEVA